MTSDNDTEISECVNLVLEASRLGLVHESINVNRIHDYTRSWFACESFPLTSLPYDPVHIYAGLC